MYASVPEVHYTNFADEFGIDYKRAPSNSIEKMDAILNSKDVFVLQDAVSFPMKARGAPGVALVDYDGDGDIDIYVTNGPGAANSLYQNQLLESGNVYFVDVSIEQGIDAIDMDSTGVCFGDVDNDHDPDILVLGNDSIPKLFINNAGQGFSQVSASSLGIFQPVTSPSCSMGDINGDGLLDIYIGNTFDWSSQFAMFVEPFNNNQQDILLLNQDNNSFKDVSVESGINDSYPTITWAVALVDIDQDGDADIVSANDQGPIPPAEYGGIDRGYIKILKNDGHGKFTDATIESGTNKWGFWMGLAFGDFNNDKKLDIFASNMGSYATQLMPLPHSAGDTNSKWFLASDNGKFYDPGLGDLNATPFGWGAVAEDYDNDADLDIIFFGNDEPGGFFVDSANPGVVLNNDGSANFQFDEDALTPNINNTRRSVQGVASGDLNNDGFIDIVTVASTDYGTGMPLVEYPVKLNSPFDATARFIPTFTPIDTGFTWNHFMADEGSMSIEMNSGNTSSHSLSVKLLGTKNITQSGQSNRDGIGAIVSVKLEGGKMVTKPLIAGASYASQNSLELLFGLGSKNVNYVEVFWPGGTKNRIYNVKRGTKSLLFPEIPCSYDDVNLSFSEYRQCLFSSLKELIQSEVIPVAHAVKLYDSAIKARQRSN